MSLIELLMVPMCRDVSPNASQIVWGNTNSWVKIKLDFSFIEKQTSFVGTPSSAWLQFRSEFLFEAKNHMSLIELLMVPMCQDGPPNASRVVWGKTSSWVKMIQSYLGKSGYLQNFIRMSYFQSGFQFWRQSIIRISELVTERVWARAWNQLEKLLDEKTRKQNKKKLELRTLN